MISNRTLGALFDQAFRVQAHCNDQFCRHSVELDLGVLVVRLGREFVAIGNPSPLASRLSCAKCGGKDIGLILSPAGTSSSVGSHSNSNTGTKAS